MMQELIGISWLQPGFLYNTPLANPMIYTVAQNNAR